MKGRARLLPLRRGRLGELEYAAHLQPGRVGADRFLIHVVDRLPAVGVAVELERDLVQAVVLGLSELERAVLGDLHGTRVGVHKTARLGQDVLHQDVKVPHLVELDNQMGQRIDFFLLG